MKKTFKLAYILIFLFSGIYINAETEKETPKEKTQKVPEKWDFIPETAADVNGEKITKEELVSFIQISTDPRMLFRLSGKELKNFTREMLERLINQVIQAKIAESEGYKPSLDLIKKETELMLSKIPKKQKEAFLKKLSSRNMTLDDLCRKKSENTFECRQVAIDSWFEKKILPETKVSEEEIKTFYNKAEDMVGVSQILIKYDANSKDSKSAAKKQAEEILKSIKDGKDFYVLAATKSQCNSNYNGRPGAIKPFPRGQMVQEFEDVAFSLPVGEVSDVIETPFGFHIIKIDTKTKRKLPGFDKIKDQIRNQLIHIKAQDKIIAKIKAANQHWKIEIKPFK